jgi:hypothetical protein
MKLLNLILLGPCFILLVGCGLGGETRKFKINYDVTQYGQQSPKLVLSRLLAHPEAAKNQAVMVIDYGRFSKKDLTKLEESFVRTFGQFHVGHPVIEIDVYIHQYALAFSNDEIAGLVVIDWCMRKDGELIFDELFYASVYSGESFLGIESGTLGYRKDQLNKAIVSYITEMALCESTGKKLVKQHELIHKNPEEALSALPVRIDSSTGVVPSGNYHIVIPGSGMKSFFEGVVSVERINWEAADELPHL